MFYIDSLFEFKPSFVERKSLLFYVYKAYFIRRSSYFEIIFNTNCIVRKLFNIFGHFYTKLTYNIYWFKLHIICKLILFAFEYKGLFDIL